MTTFAFPSIVPNTSNWSIESNTASFVSPLSGAVQTIDRGGERWRVKLTFRSLRGADKAVMRAFLSRLNGQQHRFTLHDHSIIQRGAFGGTPVVAGGAQTGTSLDVDGCSSTVTNWIRAGDMFSVDGDLKMCVADADTNGSGEITIDFVPRIVTAPADNDPLTTSSPTGVFMLLNNAVEWVNEPGDFATFTIDAIEDLLA